MVMNIFKRTKSLDEVEEEHTHLQAEDEKLGTELSIAKKKVAIAELKKRGLTPGHFGSWEKVFQWLKTH